MSSFFIIIIILVILVISVVAISVIQKREQAKQLIRQKVSQHKYRANQALTILSNFTMVPIGPEARKIIMLYCLANYNAILKLTPDDSSAKNNIESLKQSIENPQIAADSQNLKIPGDIELLNKQITQLSTLAKFILKLNKTNMANSNLAPAAVNRIMGLISESKVCAYIQQGKDALSRHEYVPAQRNFTMAQQMMLKIDNKNERVKQLEIELQELIKSSPKEALTRKLSIEQPVDSKPKEGDLFGPRKKW